MKGKIADVNYLAHFDPKLRTRLIADASPVGLGAVLVQFHGTEPRPIAYASKSLTDTEKKYHQTEKEALALVWAVERFHLYLFGMSFELETDHKPLQTLFAPESKPCLRVERWVLRLQAYTFKIVYRKGAENVADPLSRLLKLGNDDSFDEDSSVYIKNVTELAAVDISEIERATEEDDELKLLKDCLVTGHWNFQSPELKAYQPFRDEFGSAGELIIRGDRLVIPRSLRQRMLEIAHEGHPGRTVMTRRLRYVCWWPKMDDNIKDFVRKCSGCLVVSSPDPPEPMKRREMPKAPWQDLAIDFMGPLPSQENLLVVVDYYSRYKEVKVLKTITAATTIKHLEEIFTRLGYPETLTLDNGRQFASAEFDDYCRARNIKLLFTTPYWPSENGEVERQNRSLLKRLKISAALHRDWKQDLQAYLIMYLTTPHSTTGRTPSELLLGRTIRSKLPSLSLVGRFRSNEDFMDQDKEKKSRGRETENEKRRARASDLKEGDDVIMKNVLSGNKLTPTFSTEKAKILAKEGSRVTIETEGGRKYQRNASHLKKIPADFLAEDEPTNQPTPTDHHEGEKQAEARSKRGEATVTSKEAHNKTDGGQETKRRAQRAVRPPARLRDCVLHDVQQTQAN